ncbi:MAG: hypothetical protein J5506_00555 [Prevotella sp.]|nr:hypothetical protein [Prevotella sp.]
MKDLRFRVFSILLVLGCLSATAQEKVESVLSSDLVSQYIWRGMHMGGVSLQPELDLGWKGLSLMVSGNVGLVNADDVQEIDVNLSYTTGGLTLGVVDYWSDTTDSHYFNYGSKDTSHVFEAILGYDFGVVNAMWQTNFAGCDGLDSKGRRAYSSYFELTAPFSLATCEWEASLGIVPWGTTYYKTSEFSVTNVSIKTMRDIKITDHFSLPVFAQFIGNPSSKCAYFVFGITLRVGKI